MYFDDFLMFVRVLLHRHGRVAGRVQPAAHSGRRHHAERQRQRLTRAAFLKMGHSRPLFSLL